MEKAGWKVIALAIHSAKLENISAIQNKLNSQSYTDVKATQIYPTDDTTTEKVGDTEVKRRLYDAMVWYTENEAKKKEAEEAALKQAEQKKLEEKCEDFKKSDRFKAIMESMKKGDKDSKTEEPTEPAKTD